MNEYYWSLEINSFVDGALLHSLSLGSDEETHGNPATIIREAVRQLEIAGWFPVPDSYEPYGVRWVKLDDAGSAMLYKYNENDPLEYEEHPELVGAVVTRMWGNRGVIDEDQLEDVMKVQNEYNDPLWGDEDEY